MKNVDYFCFLIDKGLFKKKVLRWIKFFSIIMEVSIICDLNRKTYLFYVFSMRFDVLISVVNLHYSIE